MLQPQHHHLQHVLQQWYNHKDHAQWVLAVIYHTQGSCYRKTGSIMLISDQGHSLGLLSGGCLEADLRRRARFVLQSQQYQHVQYDSSDADDIHVQLGLGCGGVVDIALLPLSTANNFLNLAAVHQALQQQHTLDYVLSIDGSNSACRITKTAPKYRQTAVLNQQQLRISCAPLPHVLIVGAGVDSYPLVAMLRTLGWQISVFDPNIATRQVWPFTEITPVANQDALATALQAHAIHAAIVMSHNVMVDAQALQLLQPHGLDYIGLLGPTHRKQQVLEQAGLNEAAFNGTLFGPAGIALGGDLPESIALSILSQCHQTLLSQ